MVAVGGRLGRGGRHVVLPARTQIGNLWLTVANHMNAPLEKFGDSTGTIELF
jgi:hypothetical protein